jgi:hypothetical protein
MRRLSSSFVWGEHEGEAPFRLGSHPGFGFLRDVRRVIGRRRSSGPADVRRGKCCEPVGGMPETIGQRHIRQLRQVLRRRQLRQRDDPSSARRTRRGDAVATGLVMYGPGGQSLRSPLTIICDGHTDPCQWRLNFRQIGRGKNRHFVACLSGKCGCAFEAHGWSWRR